MAPLSRTIADFVVDLEFGGLPDEVVDKVSLHVLDVLGVCVLSGQLPIGPRLLRVARSVTGDQSEATIVGSPDRLSPVGAAFVNSALAHSAEFDDTYAPGRWHGSAPVIPVALAVAEERGAGGSELVTAIAAGLEFGCRLTRAAPGILYNGFHSTATAGIFGGGRCGGTPEWPWCPRIGERVWPGGSVCVGDG
jgi:2-methylcitrate dehydratase PrpD